VRAPGSVPLSPFRSVVEAKLLGAANYLAALAKELEAASGPLTPQRRQNRQSLVIASVLTSVAFLEVTLNSVWDDLGKLNGLPPSWFRRRRHLARVWELGVPENLKLPLLARFDLTLAITDSPALASGAKPYQDVQGLILLRNAISHHKPEWEFVDTANPTASPTVIRNLERHLKGRFTQDTAWKGRATFFPDRCLSADCARWAVSSVRSFATEFFSRLGVLTTSEAVIRITIEHGTTD
jgi:hypothetical protein